MQKIFIKIKFFSLMKTLLLQKIEVSYCVAKEILSSSKELIQQISRNKRSFYSAAASS